MLCRSTARAEPYHDENAGGPAKLILDQLLADGVDITDPAALHPGPSRPGSAELPSNSEPGLRLPSGHG